MPYTIRQVTADGNGDVDAAMAISVQCSGCEKKLKVKDELAGMRVKCPSCGQVIVIPAVRPASQPKAPIPSPGELAAATKAKPIALPLPFNRTSEAVGRGTLVA